MARSLRITTTFAALIVIMTANFSNHEFTTAANAAVASGTSATDDSSQVALDDEVDSSAEFTPDEPLVGDDAPLASAATCYRSGCDGKGPVATHCDDDGVLLAWTSYLPNNDDGYAELFYSPTCEAFWSRGHSVPAVDPGYYTVWISKYTKTSPVTLKGHYKAIVEDNNCGGTSGCLANWTSLIGGYPYRKYRACGVRGSVTRCTAWFDRLGRRI